MGGWRARPVLSRALQGLVLVVPVGGGLGASLVLADLLPTPRGAGEMALWWAAVGAAAAGAVLAADRLGRLLLPLSALLRLSLLFPDRVPSRMGVAFRARSLSRLQARAWEETPGTPEEAALTLVGLVGALSAHDRRTRRHCERVRAYADLIGEEMGLSEGERHKLRWSALLHDVGKLFVPPDLLNKREAPNPSEWEELYRHPQQGARLAAPLQSWLGEWAEAIAQHHERWDGSGYPGGLEGGRISLGARIVAVADAYDTMTAARPYRAARSSAWARAELVRRAGSQFDPAVVRAFLSLSLGRPPGWLVGPGVALASLAGWIRRLPREVATVTTALITVGVAGVTGGLGTPGGATPGRDAPPMAALERLVDRPPPSAVALEPRAEERVSLDGEGEEIGGEEAPARPEPVPAAPLPERQPEEADPEEEAPLLSVESDLLAAGVTADVGEDLDLSAQLRLGDTSVEVATEPTEVDPLLSTLTDLGEDDLLGP